jgi:hypothetical protein
MPPDWKGGWFEGTWDYEPKNLPSASQGGDTIFVTVTVVPGSYEQNAQQPTKPTVINGNRALEWRPSSLEDAYAIEWLGCPGYQPTCSSNFSTQTLIARMRASNGSLYTTYARVGEQIIRTIDHYDGSTPVHGTVASGIKTDEFTKALVRFLDARVEGIGADELMSRAAASQFSDASGCPDLYQTRTSHEAWTGYQVSSRTDHGQRATFIEGMGVGNRSYIEPLVVGRTSAGSPAQIVARESGCS